MNYRLSIAALFVPLVALTGCFRGFSVSADSEPKQTKSIETQEFTKIELNGSADMTVRVGPAASISVEGSQQRIERLTTSYEGGTLVFKEKSSGLFGSHGPLHITVTVPALTALTINGSGDAVVSEIAGQEFSIAINGSGDVEALGQTENLAVTVNGSGNVEAKGLEALDTNVNVTGSGDATTTTKNSLQVNVIGSGNVTYFGEPKLNKSVAGSGEVNKGKS